MPASTWLGVGDPDRRTEDVAAAAGEEAGEEAPAGEDAATREDAAEEDGGRTVGRADGDRGCDRVSAAAADETLAVEVDGSGGAVGRPDATAVHPVETHMTAVRTASRSTMIESSTPQVEPSPFGTSSKSRRVRSRDRLRSSPE
jgi:hypothetical protein